MDTELGSGKRQTKRSGGGIRSREPHLTSGGAGVLPSSAWSPLAGVNRSADDADAELNWRC